RQRAEEGDRVETLRRANGPAGTTTGRPGIDCGASGPRGEEREGADQNGATVHASGLSRGAAPVLYPLRTELPGRAPGELHDGTGEMGLVDEADLGCEPGQRPRPARERTHRSLGAVLGPEALRRRSVSLPEAAAHRLRREASLLGPRGQGHLGLARERPGERVGPVAEPPHRSSNLVE